MTASSPLDRFRTVLAGATRAIAEDPEAEVVFASDASGQSPGKVARVVSPGPGLEPRLIAEARGAADALALVGLAQRRAHFPAQLSGGEQQRVAIARAIAKRPAVLLCDEPTGALDVATGIRVLETIVHANEELGTTTLLITHNADIASIGDRVIRFADGAIRAIDVNPARARPGNLHW